jgi:hypothetical protein
MGRALQRSLNSEERACCRAACSIVILAASSVPLAKAAGADPFGRFDTPAVFSVPVLCPNLSGVNVARVSHTLAARESDVERMLHDRQ